MISFPVVRYVLTAAIRDRLILSLALLMIVGASLAVFLGSAAVTEADQFAVVFAAGGLRFTGALGLVLFTVFYIRRAFETRDIDYLLSRPVSRVTFVVSHAAAFTLMAMIVALLVSITICAIAPQAVGPGYGLWAFSLMMEYIIIVNAALFFAMVLPNAAAGVLAVFALYVLARILGQLLGIANAGLADPALPFLSGLMKIIALIVPRLDLFAQSSWLVYGTSDIGFGFVILQGLLWSSLAILATMVDLVRRQF